MSLKVLNQFQCYEKIFRFLFGLKKLKSYNVMMTSCTNFESFLKHDAHSYVNRNIFLWNLNSNRSIAKSHYNAVVVLKNLKIIDDFYINLWITYHIL